MTCIVPREGTPRSEAVAPCPGVLRGGAPDPRVPTATAPALRATSTPADSCDFLSFPGLGDSRQGSGILALSLRLPQGCIGQRDQILDSFPVVRPTSDAIAERQS